VLKNRINIDLGDHKYVAHLELSTTGFLARRDMIRPHPIATTRITVRLPRVLTLPSCYEGQPAHVGLGPLHGDPGLLGTPWSREGAALREANWSWHESLTCHCRMVSAALQVRAWPVWRHNTAEYPACPVLQCRSSPLRLTRSVWLTRRSTEPKDLHQ
jgi:hypothetical protein